MSPLWREQVQVLVAPSELVLVRFGRGMRPAVLNRAVVPVAEAGGSGAVNWGAALHTLSQVLETDAWKQGDLSFVLSNHFLRYHVLEWRDELSGEPELIEYARQQFRRISGKPSANWAVEISIDRVGTPFVAAAVDPQLVDELRACALHTGREALSIEPMLMEVFNWVRPLLAETYQWLVIVEDGMVCAGLVGKRRWVAIRMFRVGADWPHEVVAVLEREQFLLEDAESATAVLIHVVSGSDRDMPSMPWSVKRIHRDVASSMSASVVSCAV